MEKDQPNTQAIAQIIAHIDYLIGQFRGRIVEGGAVQSRVIHSHWRQLSTIRKEDNNLWLKTMLSYYLRLKTYYEHFYNFVDNATINLISSNYKHTILDHNQPTIDLYEKVLFDQIQLFTKNTRKLEI